jgi:hypothetical protein
MSEQLTGRVGHFGYPTKSAGENPLALSPNQALKVVQASGFHEDQVARGNVYTGLNVGGTPVIFQAGLSATTPPLTLYNPVGSVVNLRLVQATIAISTNPAATAWYALAANAVNATAPASTTLAQVFNNANPGITAAPVGQCYAIATLAAAPVAFHYFPSVTWGSAVGISPCDIHTDFKGLWSIPPGVAISFQSKLGVALGVCSITWEEVPV